MKMMNVKVLTFQIHGITSIFDKLNVCMIILMDV